MAGQSRKKQGRQGRVLIPPLVEEEEIGETRPGFISGEDHEMMMKWMIEYLQHGAVKEFFDLMGRQTAIRNHTLRQIQRRCRARVDQVRLLDQTVPRPEYFQRDRQRWARRLKQLNELLQGEKRLARQQQDVFQEEIQQWHYRIDRIRAELNRLHTIDEHLDAPFFPLRMNSLQDMDETETDECAERADPMPESGVTDQQQEPDPGLRSSSLRAADDEELRPNRVRRPSSRKSVSSSSGLGIDGERGPGTALSVGGGAGAGAGAAGSDPGSMIMITDRRHPSMRRLSGLRHNQSRLETDLAREAALWNSHRHYIDIQVRRIHDRRKQQLRLELDHLEAELRSSRVAIETYDRALDDELLGTGTLNSRIRDLVTEHGCIRDRIQQYLDKGRDRDQHQYQTQRLNRMLKATFGSAMIRLNHQLSIFSSGSDRIQLVLLCPRCHHLLRQPQFVVHLLMFICERCLDLEAGGSDGVQHQHQVDAVRCEQLESFLTRLDMLQVQIHSMRQMQRNLASRLVLV